MENDAVRYSRAGDEFHYRWAARRCLRMIYPKSPLRHIIIEGSKERERAGEFVIDVAEYSELTEDGSEKIVYYQLKHTTIRKEQPFNLSDLKDTIEGFSERYSSHFTGKNGHPVSPAVTFSIVTNRPIAESFKKNILTLGNGGTVNQRFQKTIKDYTKFKNKDLKKFCASLVIFDGEGDYNEQRHQLHTEISQLLAGTVDNPQIENIVALVRGKVLPDSDGKIVREDILKRFGVTSERDLFPAPPEFEKINKEIKRKQYDTLLGYIHKASTPIIVHAASGVGKSVFACQAAQSLPLGSLGIVYDCFGGGRYRNRSKPRHRHRDALVQMANELAVKGLCAPLIAQSTALPDEILRKFLSRLSIASESLKKANDKAILMILVDAADNAEMAAKEFGESCFANELLRESLPEGCRLVVLCRPERIDLLNPSNAILQLELKPFSRKESLIHLRTHFPKATENDGLEFHRLTNGGNPRVQSYALSPRFGSVGKMLNSLGPSGTTVEEQIEEQLNSAIFTVKDMFPADYQNRIDAICLGLANLHPFIPVSVLATAADVDEPTVKSFITDLGRHLWLSDTSVQFRDEPTETWFKNKFSATVEQIASYAKRLKKLAEKSSYVAETLPSLLLQAEKYDELIYLALSDNYLPDNPINKRNIRVYRLKFAFRAALKSQRYPDATKLALCAGEEVAGDKRQLEILKSNVDLVGLLQSRERVQELAFQSLLRNGWDGSENVYSAALLSSIDDFKGEAIGYLRAAENWLHSYFNERKNKGGMDHLTVEDIVELTFAHFNLFGVPKTVISILKWRPQSFIYSIALQFIRRLIDAGEFDAIYEILQMGTRNQYLVIAIVYELSKVGRFPSADSIDQCLTLLSTRRLRIPKPDDRLGYDTIISAIVSFTEACTTHNLSRTKILRVLRHYVLLEASQFICGDSRKSRKKRDIYFRATALRCVFSSDLEPNIDKLLPKKCIEKEQTYNNEQEIREFKQMAGGLLPWYIVRARILDNEVADIFEVAQNANRLSDEARRGRYHQFDSLPDEISHIRVGILALLRNADVFQVEKFFSDYIKENRDIWVKDRFNLVRMAFRLDHLSGIRNDLEQTVREIVDSSSSEDPDTRANWYIDLARAVLPVSPEDAAAYFNYAIEAVSKFGDEIVDRWEAVAALANRSADGGFSTQEMAYRYIRCAELIGDNVEEKNWDRGEALRICARLSPNSALAALSRWRDRDVGWFEKQIIALSDKLVSSEFISPSAGWSLSAFFKEGGLDDFATLCIKKEQSAANRQYILDTAIRDLRLNESTEESWQKIKHVSQQYSVENQLLNDILHFYAENPVKEHKKTAHQIPQPDQQIESDQMDWESILDDLELTTSQGISQAIKNFHSTSAWYLKNKEFWEEVFKRIDESEALKFLESLVIAENADMDNMRDSFSFMPVDWHHKVSVKRNWGRILESVTRRFAYRCTKHYALKEFLENIRLDDNAMSFINKGILEGLSENNELGDADAFFGFVRVVATVISPQQATDLLDFALSRFEEHIDDDFADGCWESGLTPPDEISMAFTGCVWSALGSPRAEMRWRAAHCVRRLAEIGCVNEIDALIQWMERDKVDAFGSNKFPFYNLHARQYLLIALSRVSIDNPQILRRYHAIFLKHALGNISHILIQKFSAEIALNIESSYPNTYSSKEVEQIRQVGVSQFPVKEIDSGELRSYWHVQGEVDSNLEFHHDIDFGQYWFEPLGDVFGIPRNDVRELTTEIVINKWHIDASLRKDPRVGLWHSTQSGRETEHSHGSYPPVDDYKFYLSYHSMLVVAANLLQKMPVIFQRFWEGERWTDWLHRHSLTRSDGRWLADRRDPAPLLQPDWVHQEMTENWRSEITDSDFLHGTLFERNEETWLCVFGSWEENESYRSRTESFSVSTALVSPAASQSLLNALSTCQNPYDYKLPEYQEERTEFRSYPFELKGWIWSEDTGNGLDQYDPHAGQLNFPPYQVGQSIVEKLRLSVDSEQREWLLPNAVEACMLCELWSTNKPGYDVEPLRNGNRVSASLALLKNLCCILECEIVFNVKIYRSFKRDYYKRDDDEKGYQKPHSKIYILSADGKLRDTETDYQLR